MPRLAAHLLKDEAGFIVSAELVLVATIAVLAMVVGLSEVAHNINNELEDIGSAFGNLTQTYQFNGTQGHKGSVDGSSFYDVPDYCDNYCDIVSTTPGGEN
jgi:Flp pilus assembly pilin Flp